MSELRWILLAIGLLVVAGIYLLWGREFTLGRRSRKKEELPTLKREPTLGDAAIGASGSTESAEPESAIRPSTEISAEQPEPGQTAPAAAAKSDAQKIVVLHVACRGSQRIGGKEVFEALQAEGMQLGKFDIFHRLDSNAGETVFSAANMIEPGTFPADKLEQISTPGISLFLVLPGPREGAEAFSDMLITARNLAQRVGAEVLDEQGSSLSNQTAGHIREEILAFQLRVRSREDAPA